MVFDRVTDIWIESEDGYVPLNYSKSNKKLYRIAADIYKATFLKIVGDFTWHVLDIVPKDRYGNEVDDLKTARVDADKNEPGIQELKEWIAVIEYLRSFPDTDRDGISDVPEKYSGKLGRIVVKASWNPFNLIKSGTYITWIAFLVFITVLVIVGLIVWFLVKKIRKWQNHGQIPV